MNNKKMSNRNLVTWALMVGVILTCSNSLWSQENIKLKEQGLLPMVPDEAVFILERRGRDKIDDVVRASNFGKLVKDDAIQAMVTDSRINIGKMIARDMFDLTNEQEITKHQKLIHSMLKPFWYKPCVMFGTMPKGKFQAPGMGFYCVLDNNNRKECLDAIELLMASGVPTDGSEGTRQKFTYKSQGLVWQGVAKGYSPWKLPAGDKQQRQALAGKDIFMVCTSLPVLAIALNLDTADAIGKALSPVAKARIAPSYSNNLALTLNKTHIKDWAFRWFVDTGRLMKEMNKARPGSKTSSEIATLYGMDKLHAAGGTGGYEDKVYTRKTFLYAPEAMGFLGLFKQGGDYTQALKMIPADVTFRLAGQMNIQKTIEGYITTAMKASGKKKMPEDTAKVLAQIKIITDNSAGHAAMFVTDLQSLMMGMMGGAGLPVGFVIDTKNEAKTAAAIQKIIELTKMDIAENKNAIAPKKYCDILIQHIGNDSMGPSLQIAMVKNRVIFAFGDGALKAAIDTALDGDGGIAAGSDDDKLLKLAGKGAGVFTMDLKAIVKIAWPFLMQASQSNFGDFFPLKSLPSTGKLAKLVGTELAVFESDKQGMMIKSRGTIPFATKAPTFYFLGMFMVFAPSSCDVPAAAGAMNQPIAVEDILIEDN